MESSHIDLARESYEFASAHSAALLSTHSSIEAGFPFGSLVKYAISHAGEIIIYISLIAEHYKNLTSSNKASLFIIDLKIKDDTDPLSLPRATLLLEFSEAKDNHIKHAKNTYLSKFPNDVPQEISSNFKFFIGTVKKIRWIKGFGKMGWVSDSEWDAVFTTQR